MVAIYRPLDGFATRFAPLAIAEGRVEAPGHPGLLSDAAFAAEGDVAVARFTVGVGADRLFALYVGALPGSLPDTRGLGGDAARLGPVDPGSGLCRPAGRRADALGPGAQGADLRAHGGDRGRRHHLPSGGDRWHPQLGLPLLLDPRCLPLLLRAEEVRHDRRGRGVLRLRPRSLRPGGGPAATTLYAIAGKVELAEAEIGHCAGWRGSTPVRSGNEAAEQNQADAYGQVLDLLYVYERLGGVSPRTCAPMARGWPTCRHGTGTNPMRVCGSRASPCSAIYTRRS